MKRIIAEIYEDYNIVSFPIDIYEITKLMGFKILFLDDDISQKLYNILDGYSYYSSSESTYVINLIRNNNEERQRFTIAHEIGHIILGHRNSNDDNEKEANFFASYLLAPSCLCFVSKIDQIMNNIELLSKYFRISLSAATSVSDRMIKRHNIKQAIQDYEMIIINQINKKPV